MCNNISLDIQSFIDDMIPTLAAVNKVLDAWDGKGCYQLPLLMLQVKAEMNWDDTQKRSKDPIVREFLRNHPKWVVRNGAHGGVMLRSEKTKQEEAKLEKAKAKLNIMATIDAEVARKMAALQTVSQPSIVADDFVDDEPL